MLTSAIPDDDCPFGVAAMPRRRVEPCPNCSSTATSVNYGQVDDDKNLPEPVKAGKLPAYCETCGHQFFGSWI